MPLRLAGQPEEGAELLRSRLLELVGRADSPIPVLARVDPADISLAAPHDVYNIGLDDLAAGTISAVKLTGRRYLVLDNDRAVVAAEVVVDAAGAIKGYSHTNAGPFVEATEAALGAAEGLPEVLSGSYEARILRAPSLNVMALWLKDDDGDRDLYIPMPPTAPELIAGRRYEASEFLRILRGAAQRRQAAPSGVDA